MVSMSIETAFALGSWHLMCVEHLECRKKGKRTSLLYEQRLTQRMLWAFSGAVRAIIADPKARGRLSLPYSVHTAEAIHEHRYRRASRLLRLAAARARRKVQLKEK